MSSPPINVAVVLARAGSKRLPDKNIKLLGGKPLLAYAIELGRVCACIHDVLVSTDSPKIQAIALEYGAKAPFLRPPELSTDEADSYDALRHAVLFYERAEVCLVDNVILLQPTSPFTTRETVEKVVHMLGRFEFCHTVTVPSKRFEWIGELQENKFVPFLEEEKRKKYAEISQTVPSGNVYAMSRKFLMERPETAEKCGVPVSAEEAIDIDHPLDFEFAEFLMMKNRRGG